MPGAPPSTEPACGHPALEPQRSQQDGLGALPHLLASAWACVIDGLKSSLSHIRGSPRTQQDVEERQQRQLLEMGPSFHFISFNSG